MTTQSPSKYSRLVAKLARPLISAGLIFGGLFQMVSPVLALGTAAGININNTATATFEDPNDPGVTRETVSNTVTVTIAEIAGLTNVAQSPVDPNAGSVIPGDTVQFPFLITNTGNNVTGIYVPTTLTNITTQNLNSTGALILIDTDNNGTPNYIVNPADQNVYNATGTSVTATSGTNGTTYALIASPTALTAPELIAANLTASGTPTTTGYVVGGVSADDSIRVTIQGSVSSVVSGSLVTARLGNTPPNDSNDVNSQNQPDTGVDSDDTAASANDVRTVDGTGGTPEVTGNPVNGEREAADTSDALTVGTIAPKPLALATIFKTAASVANTATPALTDDVITYGLSLDVENTVPLGITDYNPAPLEGTLIKVGTVANTTTAGTYVLVSDAIPALTTLATATPLAPTNWTIVYTAEPLTITPTEADWYESTTAALSDTQSTGAITRVGFVYDTVANGSIANGTTVTGFEFYVQATGAGADDNSTAYTVSDIDGDLNTTEAAPIYNIAQVFGQTEGDTGNNTVFDESGDQAPNNSDDDGTAPANDNAIAGDEVYGDYLSTATTGNTGVVDTTAQIADTTTDANNNNSGTGTDGEANKVSLSTPPTPPAPGNLLTGPLNNTDAVGAIGQNDDFTNKSTTEGVTTGVSLNPAAVTFTNSVKNVSGIDLDNVVLRPISPTNASAVCVSCDYIETTLVGDVNLADVTTTASLIPNDGTVNNTVVTIFVDNDGNGVADDANGDGNLTNDTATYAWNGSDFVLIGTNLVQIPTLTIGSELDYKVIVNLPSVPAHTGYSIPVVAYVNNDPNESFNPATELINNVTIDRIYSGFLRLNKEARLLKANGTTTTYSTGAITGAVPGDIIQYRITYTNVSTAVPPSGQFNVALPATNVVIIENGVGDNTSTSTNNWALDQDVPTNGIDTQNVTGAATASQGPIQYYNGDPAAPGIDQSGPTAASDVTEYRNSVGTVNPQGTGTFTFQREVQ